MKAEDIESLSIHPAIGIARIGNAPDDWFLAPEIRGGIPQDSDDFRDADGRIKRQVARFRVYATLKSGEVREVTIADAKITWRVHVANLKGGWYDFYHPLDLAPEAVRIPDRRNANVTGADRILLDICPTPKQVSGANVQGPEYRFDDGSFYGKPVYLGELRTDEAGRLLFFGGVGNSAHRVPGTRPETFANNEGWHDDICDGPVRASVEIGETAFEATPAHVVVAPPNYGPGLFGIVTMDDVVRDLFVREGWLPAPQSTSFSQDIWPIFDRMTGHQWVNDGILLVAGQGAPLDARDPKVIARLADASSAGNAFRHAVFALFRRTDPPQDRPDALPPVYGDTTGDRIDRTHEELLLTKMQYEHLRRWADGDFISDWSGVPAPADFDALPPEAQAEELDRAAMFECLGGPFHPGIEITWPFRLGTMWQGPYRLRALPEGEPARQDYGPELSRDVALAEDGPHGASGPGSLTRWLGVPWQTDEASCNSGRLYSPQLYLSTPTFWGARVPNQVLPREAYEIAVMPDLPSLQADRHFSNRRQWLRDINGLNYLQRINNMVSKWWEIGMVTAISPPKRSGLPDPCFVETGRKQNFTSDPTLTLAHNVIALVRSDAAGLKGLVAGVEAEEEGPPPKRDYIQYGRGEV